MLNFLDSQNLCNILLIVTRYFGGILLGTGGLVRAYTQSSVEALNKAQIVDKELGMEVEFKIDYCDLEKIKYYFKQQNSTISDIKYDEKVKIIAEMTQENLNRMLEQRRNLNFVVIDYKILKEKFIIV